MATHATGHVVPSKNRPPGQELHSVLRGPVQVWHSPWQTSQVFVAVFGYFPAGQVVGHPVISRYLTPVQLRHWVLLGPLHVSHSAWHESHVFVVEFSKRAVFTHAVGQAVPSKNLPVAQLEHVVFVAAVHV